MITNPFPFVLDVLKDEAPAGDQELHRSRLAPGQTPQDIDANRLTGGTDNAKRPVAWPSGNDSVAGGKPMYSQNRPISGNTKQQPTEYPTGREAAADDFDMSVDPPKIHPNTRVNFSPRPSGVSLYKEADMRTANDALFEQVDTAKSNLRAFPNLFKLISKGLPENGGNSDEQPLEQNPDQATKGDGKFADNLSKWADVASSRANKFSDQAHEASDSIGENPSNRNLRSSIGAATAAHEKAVMAHTSAYAQHMEAQTAHKNLDSDDGDAKAIHHELQKLNCEGKINSHNAIIEFLQSLSDPNMQQQQPQRGAPQSQQNPRAQQQQVQQPQQRMQPQQPQQQGMQLQQR